VSSKKHWATGSEVIVQRVDRTESGGWIVSGTLAPNVTCRNTLCIRGDTMGGGIDGFRASSLRLSRQ
jgi:hypothetical protein